MNKYLLPILAFISLCICSCSNHYDKMGDWMYWSHDNQSPDDIKYSYLLDAVSMLFLEVNYKGGDITLICNNYDNLEPIGIDGSDTYDCGWGKFTVEGRQIKCHFPEDALGNEPMSEQITISAMNGKEIVNTILYVTRSFTCTDSDELPDKYKFKLVQGALMPFMNGDFGAAAPFDNLSFRITDYYDHYQALGFPEFTQPYDSIVWCAEGFPNTLKVYERQNTASSSEEHFSSQWSSHFFTSTDVKSQLKGYRDGKVVYSTPLTTNLYERDFLCYDWTDGNVVIANPGNEGIYCLLDKRYEYTARHTMETDGTRYAQISARLIKVSSNEESLAYQQEALTKLMTDNIGQAQTAAGKTESFKCLPTEGIEAIKFWENKTTRILLLHKIPDEDYGREKYYLHFEAKAQPSN